MAGLLFFVWLAGIAVRFTFATVLALNAKGLPEETSCHMCCMFCRSEENLTDEHIFPAFMGGELVVRNGSCKRCNREFSLAEAALKKSMVHLLNLLQIENRYGVVPNAPLNVEVRGLDLKKLPAFMDGRGEINLVNVVRESVSEDGRKLRQGFFLRREDGDRFAERALAKGAEVKGREVPKEIVIEVEYTILLPFIESFEARKVAAKIAMTAIAFEYGIPFALSPQIRCIQEGVSRKSRARPARLVLRQ